MPFRQTYRNTLNLLESTQVYFDDPRPDEPGLTVVRVSQERWKPAFAVRSRNPATSSLWWVAGGTGFLRTGGNVFELRRGCAVAVHAYGSCDIWNDPADPMSLMVAQFAGREGARLLRGALPAGRPVAEAGDAAVVERIFSLLYDTALNCSPFSQRSCSLLIPVLINAVCEDRAAETPAASHTQHPFNRCRAYIDANRAALRSVKEGAKALGMTPTHLGRLFRINAKTTPYRYLMDRKADLAAHLLRTTDAPVKEIAAILSFSDQYVFSKAFKRGRGVSPTAYRQTV